jgi:uncharacterized protein YkwD
VGVRVKMAERLRLTKDEIARLEAQARTNPPTPPVLMLRITADDLRPAPPQPANALDLAELETLLFGLVNSARQRYLPRWLGNPNLRWHAPAAAVARGHAADMLRRQYVDHVSPEGVKVAQRLARHGIHYLACGENIGIVYGANSHGAQGIVDIHNAFMNQPARLTNHRGNVLNPIWSHVGIGVAYRPQGGLVVAQNFIAALPPSR